MASFFWYRLQPQSKMKDSHGWAHFVVDWVADEKYTQNVLESKDYRHRRQKEIYRSDELYPLELERLSFVAQCLEEYNTK